MRTVVIVDVVLIAEISSILRLVPFVPNVLRRHQPRVLVGRDWSSPPVAAVSRLNVHEFPFLLRGSSRFARGLAPRFHRALLRQLILGSSPAVVATIDFAVSAQISILFNRLDLSAAMRNVDNVILMKHGQLRGILHLRGLVLQFLQPPQPRIQIRVHRHFRLDLHLRAV